MTKLKLFFAFVVTLYAFMVFPSFAKRVEVPKHLNGLSKHPVKSIKSPDGDIIDCIHILHQPAFDHPLLKNHTIKMRPSYHPNWINNDAIKNASSSPPITQLWHSNGKCPKETIPIRRKRKDDVFVQKHGKKSPFDSELDNIYNHEWAHAFIEGRGQYYGAQATFNIWNPSVQLDELSLGQVWITAGYETIEAGWQVYTSMYGDSTTRFFIFWTNDGYQNTHCYNLDCGSGGFIQTNNEIVLGGSISPISELDGSQYDITILIWKDPKDGNWWLEVDGTILGYWPSSLYTHLSEFASMLDWGGEITNNHVDGYHTTTQMGSGQFSEEGFGKASYIKNIQMVDESISLRSPDEDLTVGVSRKGCYDVTMGNNDVDGWGTYFFFGGPGRNDQCV